MPRTRDDNKQVVQTKETRRSDQQAGLNGSKVICRLRYQQTAIDVYAKFIAVDDNSGRESYLLNRKSAFRVTELVEEYIRIADSRIASLKGHIIQGQSMGRTEVQASKDYCFHLYVENTFD